MGKKLISGSGEGSSAITFWWIIFGIVAGVGILLIILSDQIPRDLAGRINPRAIYLLIVGGATFIVAIVDAGLMTVCIEQTQITVYENSIEGVGVNKNILLVYSSNLFKLTYDQITSVDTADNSITIFASSAAYKCYAENAREIQNIIFNQRNLPAGSS